MLNVLAITDEPILEAGIRTILDSSAGFALSFCKAAAHVIRLGKEAQPDVVICALPPETDLALGDLRYSMPQSAIVVISREITPEFAHQALEIGVRGFVSTTARPEDLVDCVRCAARGELWMERSLSMTLLDTRPLTFSKRQLELLRLLAQGLKNKEIAAELGLSEGTVKAYLTTLFEKVGAKDRFELALFGLKNLKNLGQERGTLPAQKSNDRFHALVSRLREPHTAA